MGRLSGKVALVTGGTRGIGRAVAVGFARAGAAVACCGRSETELATVVAEIRAQEGVSRGFIADLSRPEDSVRLVGDVVRAFGRIDVLVNNASILGPRVEMSRYPVEEWEDVIRVNLTAPFVLAKEVTPVMRRGGNGSIINVSSGVGRMGKVAWGAYAVSKFGIEGLTQVLAAELKDSNIRVNALNPGATRTSMRAAAYPEEDPLTLPSPADIVEGFVYLASDESSRVTGQSLDARDWLQGAG